MRRPIPAAIAAVLFISASSGYVAHRHGPHNDGRALDGGRLMVKGQANSVERFINLEAGHSQVSRIDGTSAALSATIILPTSTTGADIVRVCNEALDAGLSYSFTSHQTHGSRF